MNRPNLIEPAAHHEPALQSNNRFSHGVPKTPGVLLIGADFQALAIARALADGSIPVFLLEPESGIARYSRNVSRRLARYGLSADPGSVDFLLELAERESLEGWIIFCVDDEVVEFLAKNRAALSKKFIVPVPSWEITRNFYEKDRATAIARSCGIPVPVVYPSSSLDELLEADIAYPVVLKPTFKKYYYEVTHSKAVLARDRAELICEFAAMNQLIDMNQILIQEFLPGGTRNLFSFAAVFDGVKVVAGLSAHRIRQHPMDFGHSTTYAESRDMPELEALATRFLKAINYRGVAEVEFMFDERTGTHKFLEMNGRFWGWHALAYAAGLNLPLALYHTLQGVEVSRNSPRIGASWVRLLTDGPTVAREALCGRMSPVKFLRVLFSNTPDAVWSYRDPMPFVMELVKSPYLWYKKGF